MSQGPRRAYELAPQPWLVAVVLILLTPLVPGELESLVALGSVPLVGLFLLMQAARRRPLVELILGVSSLLGAAVFVNGWQMGGPTQFAVVLLALTVPLLAVAALATGLWRLRRMGKTPFVPLGAALAGLLGVLGCLLLGRWACDALFWWNLPRYREVVEKVRSSDTPAAGKAERLDEMVAISPRSYAVFASRGEGSELSVEFWVGTGFPAKHAGYMYDSKDEIEPGSELRRRWPTGRKMTDNWYEIRD